MMREAENDHHHQTTQTRPKTAICYDLMSFINYNF